MKVATTLGILYLGWRYTTKPVQVRPAKTEVRKDGTEKFTDAIVKEADVTTLIVKNEKKEVIAEVSVTRHYADEFDKEKARRFTLAALRNVFPRDVRKAIGAGYNARNSETKVKG